MSFATELQTAVYARIAGYSGMPAVYDAVPESESASFPYVTIGADTHTPFDTDDSVGSEATITLHIWSRYRGTKENKDIQAILYAALNRYDLPVTGFATVLVDFEFSDTMLDPDGVTRHGVMRFRALLEQV